jgi:hypothetical protein
MSLSLKEIFSPKVLAKHFFFIYSVQKGDFVLNCGKLFLFQQEIGLRIKIDVSRGGTVEFGCEGAAKCAGQAS